MDIGANIRRLREAAGLTRSQLADQVGVSQSMISQLERNSKICTLPLAVALAKCMNCDINSLIKEGGDYS